MNSPLPATGTARLLARLSSHIPDQFIHELLATRRRPGAQHRLSAAQLWRIHLLALLTPAHSFNAIVRLLPEQRAWRDFAHLPNRQVPDVRMLHEFRLRAGVSGLRAINDHLVKKLLSFIPAESKTVALIDATDLPASTADKKRPRLLVGSRRNRGSAHTKGRAHQIFRGVQKAHFEVVVEIS